MKVCFFLFLLTFKIIPILITFYLECQKKDWIEHRMYCGKTRLELDNIYFTKTDKL